jgi:hypothetical protein
VVGIVGGTDHDLITRVGSFPTVTRMQRATPRPIPAPGLYGAPIDMARVSDVHATAAGKNVPQTGKDMQTLPAVIVSYYELWLQQLKALGAGAGLDIANPFFLTR